MEITHEQAQRLIQRNTDQALSLQESSILSAHLRACEDCQTYAKDIDEVDRLLLPLLKGQWNREPLPLSISALTKSQQSTHSYYLLTTRKVAIGLVVFALFFGVWQFVLSGPTASSQLPLIAPPVPTPSAQQAPSTNTATAHENCEPVLYTVQDGDTLAGIAIQFSVSLQDLMQINQLKAEVVNPSMKLIVPVCTSTPTGTTHPATFTTTFTPITKPITSTPEG